LTASCVIDDPFDRSAYEFLNFNSIPGLKKKLDMAFYHDQPFCHLDHQGSNPAMHFEIFHGRSYLASLLNLIGSIQVPAVVRNNAQRGL
jgi:hypothetical protein